MTKRTGNTANLKPWPKGVSGNPGGRPKRLPITDALKAELARKKGRVENADAIARKLVQLAVDGDIKAIEIIADRTEGKATQRIENTGADGGPIAFEIPDSREELERQIAELLGSTTDKQQTKAAQQAKGDESDT